MKIKGIRWDECLGKKAFEVYTKLTFGEQCDVEARWAALTPKEQWVWRQIVDVTIFCSSQIAENTEYTIPEY